jgi:hypothetical protein
MLTQCCFYLQGEKIVKSKKYGTMGGMRKAHEIQLSLLNESETWTEKAKMGQ